MDLKTSSFYKSAIYTLRVKNHRQKFSLKQPEVVPDRLSNWT